MPYSSPTISVRIIYDDLNPNGWIARLLSSDPTVANKIAFITNIGSVIQDLQPGQIWEAMVIKKTEKYWRVQLIGDQRKLSRL